MNKFYNRQRYVAILIDQFKDKNMLAFYSSQEASQQKLYIELLKACTSLSNLFSCSSSPYLYYRTHENIFALAFKAINISRDDISIDAKKAHIGIGLKTFLQGNGRTYQKIAEFDKQVKSLDTNNSLALIKTISKYRNSRILFAQKVHKLDFLIYHLVTRSNGVFMIFEEMMEEIDIQNIKIEKHGIKENSILFNDGKNEYNFNFSKSTLLKRFVCPFSNAIISCNVEIIAEPLSLLLEMYQKNSNLLINSTSKTLDDYIILPLYSIKTKEVEKRSGLNHWNAKGRIRNENEVYIPVPSWIHKVKENFFNYITPDFKTAPFEVALPNGNVLSMRICQAGGKALMSCPNHLLGKWILRDVLNIPYGFLLKRKLLDEIGIDSIKLTKIGSQKYKCQFSKSGSFEAFERLYKK